MGDVGKLTVVAGHEGVTVLCERRIDGEVGALVCGFETMTVCGYAQHKLHIQLYQYLSSYKQRRVNIVNTWLAGNPAPVQAAIADLADPALVGAQASSSGAFGPIPFDQEPQMS